MQQFLLPADAQHQPIDSDDRPTQLQRWEIHCGSYASKLEKYLNGTMGYTEDGIFHKMFGPPITYQSLSSFTKSYQTGMQLGIEEQGVSIHGTSCRGITSNLIKALLMRY